MGRKKRSSNEMTDGSKTTAETKTEPIIIRIRKCDIQDHSSPSPPHFYYDQVPIKIVKDDENNNTENHASALDLCQSADIAVKEGPRYSRCRVRSASGESDSGSGGDPNKRSLANARERLRTACMNEALETLQSCIPSIRDCSFREVPRVDILKEAINYIKELTELLRSETAGRTTTDIPNIVEQSYAACEDVKITTDAAAGDVNYSSSPRLMFPRQHDREGIDPLIPLRLPEVPELGHDPITEMLNIGDISIEPEDDAPPNFLDLLLTDDESPVVDRSANETPPSPLTPIPSKDLPAFEPSILSVAQGALPPLLMRLVPTRMAHCHGNPQRAPRKAVAELKDSECLRIKEVDGIMRIMPLTSSNSV